MKTITAFFTLALIALLQFNAQSQTILSDDFESYTAGELLAANSDLWTTWSGGTEAEDALVSDAQASSGSNSVYVVGYNGPTDLILPFPEDYTTGVYEFSMKMYITSGYGGYFNIQGSSTPAVAWMIEVYFDSNGGGFIQAGGFYSSPAIAYTPDAWTDIKVKADLDNDYGELLINSASVYSWQWSLESGGTGSTNSIGGVDIFPYSADGSTADYYVDDVLLAQVPAGCNIPIGKFTSKIASNTAKVNWTAVTDANKYKLRFRETGSEVWSNVTSNKSSKMLADLAAGTQYDWQIQSICKDAGLGSSSWSPTQNFTTSSLRLSDISLQQNALEIYPNPAKDFTTIQFNLPHSSQVNIKVYDLNGREVESLINSELQPGDHSLQLNTTQFSKGVYMVRMISDAGIENQKLIVQ